MPGLASDARWSADEKARIIAAATALDAITSRPEAMRHRHDLPN